MSVANSSQEDNMGCPFYIYDNEGEEFLSVCFADLEAAEQHIERNCHGNYERYVVFKKVS